jgi:6-pyruvoyl-tetrahydropterin synthase
MPKKAVTLKAVFREVEPVDEEALVQAVRDALDEGLEAFMDALEALQDAGLLTDVVEEHGPAYLEQARYFPTFGEFTLNNTEFMPYMKDAADIQELIIDPVNEWVAEAIGAINGARTPAETEKAWEHFKKHGKSLLVFEGLELTFEEDEVSEEVNVKDDVVEELLFKYPPLSVADIRDIVYGAYVKGQVDALFQNGTVAEQEQIDEVAELVAEVAIDELKAELEAEVVKAQAWFIWEMITSDHDALETWIVNNMTFTQFDNLPYRQRIDVVLILSGLYEDKPDENFEQFIREFTQAVVPGVGKYLELLGAVNAAATNSQMVEALKGLEYYKDYEGYDIFVTYGLEDPDTQLTIAENILLKVPFETIAEIASALASAPEEIEPEL